ncbi:MAG: SHD1 domain-containing protein [Pirellulaceae bacterium]|jgi:hypothetical protein|nr:SHD1 domain-containing protein [Pirellulaceae bacterium]
MPRQGLLVILVLLALSARDAALGQQNETRLWKDSTGKFQIRAVLLEQTATAVRLHTADGREVSVPLARLSQEDLDYLKTLTVPADNPFAGGKPLPGAAAPAASSAALPGTLRAVAESPSAGEEMALPGTGNTLDPGAAPASAPFVPDPSPAAPRVAAGVAPVSPVDPYDKVSAPVLAGGAESRFLVSIGRHKSGSSPETRGRIYLVDLAGKKADLVWDYPHAVRVWDHDPASGRTLVVDKLDQFQRGGELVMVQGLTTGSPKPLYRRTLPGAGKPGFAPQVEWAKLLSGSHVAAIVDRVLCVWDLPAAKLLYRVETASSSEPPVFSGSQRYMAIPQSGKVVIVDTATGTVRKSLATGSTLTPGAAFDSTGGLLAVCFSNQYQVWDVAADKTVSQATTTDHLGSHPIHWIGPKLFRGALGDAVQLDLGMSVWKYSTSASTEPILVGDKFLVATTSQNCALASVPIPHASAQKAVDALKRAGDAAMLVRPGSAVAIAVESAGPVDQAQIEASLGQAAEKAGWKVSRSGPVTLVAKIGRGETQQLQFRSMRGAPNTVSTASLTPFTAELQIRSGANVLWTRSTENRIPSLLHLNEGETVQDAVKRYEKPDPDFFSRLDLPPRIPKPEIAAQVGLSVLTGDQWQDLKLNTARPKSR